MTEQVKDERDFDIKYRPRKLAEVVGQDVAVKTIRGFKGKIPRSILLHGHTGGGKTTLARIIAHEIMGLPEYCMDLQEINCGVVSSAIDMVREIQAQLMSSPMFGSKRVWILDEMQVFSKSKQAQEALLKVLEQCPDHVQFFICTTEPKRLLPSIRNRCVEIGINSLKAGDLGKLIDRVAKAERIAVTDEVRTRIVAISDGAARNAVKYLQKIAGIEGEDAMLEALGGGCGESTEEFELVKALNLYNGKPSWPTVAALLIKLEESDPEGLRQMILAAARTALVKKSVFPRTWPHPPCCQLRSEGCVSGMSHHR